MKSRYYKGGHWCNQKISKITLFTYITLITTIEVAKLLLKSNTVTTQMLDQKSRQKQKVSFKIFAIPVTLSTVACTQAPADMLKITSNWVLPDFCRNYCHPGIVHSHWFQTPFCSCNIWRGWLDSPHWFHVSIGLKNWSLQSSQRRNTWTGIVNRN